MKAKSRYADVSIILTTKHNKSLAIAAPFFKKLGARVVENIIDTDALGTFSGEVERYLTPVNCALKKCQISVDEFGDQQEFFLASEGSFGPHPYIPFLICDHEILYFIDRRHDFHLHLSHISEKTNFRSESLDSLEKLHKFAKMAMFPSHALIVRSHQKDSNDIFKGITSQDKLEEAFFECLKKSLDGNVFVETDMRAHLNPSRMSVIKELATHLAERLSVNCVSCNTPGWGKVRVELGLPCGLCGLKTELVKSEVFGCVKCQYQEIRERDDLLKMADPQWCHHCNP